MDQTTTFVLIGSAVLVVGMIVTAVVMFKDQTAPITGPPNKPKLQPPADSSTDSGNAALQVPQFQGQLEAPETVMESEEIQRHIAENRKIEALKLLRERTGLGLKEAKEYIDAMYDQDKYKVQGDLHLARSRVRELILSGNKIEAVKIWREATGCDLKSAADEIERISATIL